MTTQLEEHDYIGLSVTPPMGSSGKVAVVSSEKGLNLKATELRLGLPGTESPERDIDLLKGFVSGAKRGHSDSINSRSGKWVFSGGGDGSELDLGKHAGIFSPRGVNGKDVVGCEIEVIPLSPKPVPEKIPTISAVNGHGSTPSASKAQVVGWPPIRSNRKNTMATSVYVKVGMDGAPYLRKVDLKIYSNYTELSLALEKMFSCFKIGECDSDGVSSCEGLTTGSLKDSEYMLTYEDKDGDWMLVGDVPWA
ncbi:auxin-responsive protein IAA27-like isoform X2 [Impatiens glandulifera]|nr:auxin-responsive protein IAA27-like isoform X2 [Impatiens glandulifera]